MQFPHLQFIASSLFYSSFLPIEIILLKVLRIKQIIQRSGEIGLHNYLGLKIALSVYGNIQSNLTPLTNSTVSNSAEKTNGTKYWFMQNAQNIKKLQKNGFKLQKKIGFGSSSSKMHNFLLSSSYFFKHFKQFNFIRVDSN